VTVDALNPPAAARGVLADVGVLITRPVRQAGPFARKLGVLGARPIVFPAIIVLPPDDRSALVQVHGELARYDGAFFVSANAAEYGVPQGPSWPAKVPAYAPGPGTAATLTDLGVPDVHFPADDHDSEGLLALPPLQQVSGKRFVIFRGDSGRELLGDTLRARGAVVDYVSCYRRAAPTDGEGLIALLERSEVDALTLTSSEGIGNLWNVLNPAGRECLRRLPTFTTHPRISAAARERDLPVIESAPGDMGLIGGLLEWFSRHPVVARARH
jgi:uroporphyrinogen-III synthase